MRDSAGSCLLHPWEYQTGRQAGSSPCLGPGGTPHVGSDDCKLYALQSAERICIVNTGDCPPEPEKDASGVTIDDGWLVTDGIRLKVRK